MNKSFIIYRVYFIAQLCFSVCAFAQKLPSKQNASSWAPTGVKIDGKADEWDTYKAYNTATEMFYTLSNDDKNLYLVSYITSPDALFYKAIRGGIMIVIKKNNQEVSVRYPVFNTPPVIARLPKGEVFSGTDDDPIIVKDNIAFTNKSKDIEVIGVSGIDNSISIYNEYGIKAVSRFDTKQGYVYELAIPLKYLGLSANSEQTFDYQILLNGGNGKYKRKLSPPTSMTNPDGSQASQAEIDASDQRIQAILEAKYATTDFTGNYTLAKKP